MKMKVWKKTILILLLIILSLLFLSPVLLLINSSFKDLKEIYLNVLALPSHFGWDNYKEAFETMKCYDIAHLLEEAEKLAILIENDQEDEIDETSEYATYNFSDFTNEFVSLLRSSGIGDKLGEYIKEHKESFIEKDDENEKRISE